MSGGINDVKDKKEKDGLNDSVAGESLGPGNKQIQEIGEGENAQDFTGGKHDCAVASVESAGDCIGANEPKYFYVTVDVSGQLLHIDEGPCAKCSAVTGKPAKSRLKLLPDPEVLGSRKVDPDKS